MVDSDPLVEDSPFLSEVCLGMDIDNSGSTFNKCQDAVLGNFEGVK